LEPRNDDYVFVSYSSKDRSRVLPIVDSLETRGISTWIDKNRIPGGADYTQEIPAAISRAVCVTVFLSENAFKSGHVRTELNLSRKKDKTIIPILLDDVEIPENLEYQLEAVQTIQVFGRAHDEWWPDLQRALEAQHLKPRSATAVVTRRGGGEDSAGARRAFIDTPLMPYLVDRLQQEEQLGALFARHHDERWRHPVVVVAYGQTDQAVHEYLDRLERSSLPRHLRRVGYRDTVNWKNLPWPRGDWQVKPDETIVRLRTQVETVFEFPRNSWPSGVAQFVAAVGCAVVVCVRLRWEEWTELHLNTIRAWIGDWGTVPTVSVDAPLLVVLALEYSVPSPSWLGRVLAVKSGAHPIHRQLQSLAAYTTPGISFVVLTELGNVTLQDIEDWILNDLKPPDVSAMIRRARAILSDPDLPLSNGVAMERIAQRLAELLAEGAKAGGRR